MASLALKVHGIQQYTIPNQADLMMSNVGLREGKLRIFLG